MTSENNVIKVSVIVAVKNTGPYLRQCLDSIVNQTLKGLEIICVENGSSDDSLEILKEYQEKTDNLILLVHHKGRLGDARNEGMKIAKGIYIGFVDSDDFIAPEMFELMFESANKHNADMAICGVKTYYQQDNIYREKDLHIFPEKYVVTIEENRNFFRAMTAWNKIYKREFIEINALSYPEDLFYEDQLFVSQAYILANRIGVVAKPLYFYRKQRPGQICTINTPQIFDIFVVLDKLDKFADNEEKAASLRHDIAGVKIRALFYLFDFIAKEFKKEFFYRMKAEFKKIQLPGDFRLSITNTEYKNYLIIKKYPYIVAEAALSLRNYAGRILQIPFIKRAYLGIRY